jgi:DNA ligase D-like protein (predicted 3'-phosphoesterase)
MSDIRNIDALPSDKLNKLLEFRTLEFLKNDSTVKFLKENKQTDKLNKYLRELYRWAQRIISSEKTPKTASISIRAAKKKHEKAGLFILVPKNLAKEFPSLGDHDDSKPHITALFIGEVPKKHEDLLEETVKEVLTEQVPFDVELDDKVSYFPASKHSDGCKIAKLKIVSKDLHKFHDKLKEAISNAGIEIDDHFPDYKPHITLEYMEPGKEKYGDDFPQGSWAVGAVEMWNGDYKKKFSFGGEEIISKRAKDKLKEYKKKREFDKTPEPEGKVSKRDKKRFVIHNHHATKHHWDLRLEHDGVLQSWALPKHKLPSKGERQLAVKTEAHPISYIKFEGEIPEGSYGSGKSMIHDSGKYELIKWERDTIKFILEGNKEKGAYTLHNTDGKNWMIMRMKKEISKRASRSPWEIKEDIKVLTNGIKEIQQTAPDEGAGFIKMYEESLRELNEELKMAKDTPEDLQSYRKYLKDQDALKKNTEVLAGRVNKEFAVLLDEEYGYRYWIWFPKMTPRELEFWWKSLSSVGPYFFSPKGLPGEVIQDKEAQLWPELVKSKKFYSAHINEDEDSFLSRPDGTEIERKIRE